MLQLIYVSLGMGSFNANMKAKYAIKAFKNSRCSTNKENISLLHKKLYLMQIGFMQFVHKHQFYAVTQNSQSALAEHKRKYTPDETQC